MTKDLYYVVYQVEIYNSATQQMEPTIRQSYIEVEPDTKTNGRLITTFKGFVENEHANCYNPPKNIVIMNFYNMNTK